MPYRPKPTPEALARARRIAAALADELVDEAPSVAGRHARGLLECPGCGATPMDELRHGESLSMHQCATCGGAWVGVDAFDALTATPSGEPEAPPRRMAQLREHMESLAPGTEGPVEYRACPRCRALMRRRNFAEISGVMIDECVEHGVFLDAGELQAIQVFVASGGMALRQEVSRTRAASARLRRDRSDKLEAAERVREVMSRSRWSATLWTSFT